VRLCSGQSVFLYGYYQKAKERRESGEDKTQVLLARSTSCDPRHLGAEPKSRKINRNGAWRQLSFLEQFRLVFANLLGAQAVGRTMEALREFF
jgi:hypothetical protein